MADPYIKCWDQNGKCERTQIVNNSLDPIYYEVKEFFSDIFLDPKLQDSPIKILEGFPPFIMDVWDSDSGLLDSTDDFMARATIFATDASCRFIDSSENIQHQTEYAR